MMNMNTMSNTLRFASVACLWLASCQTVDESPRCVPEENEDGSVTLTCEGSEPVTLRAPEPAPGADGDDGEPGSDGADGAPTLARVQPDQAEACAQGGDLLEVGLDDDLDGSLSDSEVDFSFELCDGADGSAPLIEVVVEHPGVNCLERGLRVEVGLDANGDGILNASEVDVDQTMYLCDSRPRYDAIAIDSNGLASCLVTESGDVKCWGSNQYGILGTNDDHARNTPTTVALPKPMAALAIGAWHTCAVSFLEGEVYCWGRNNSGQLGDGTEAGRATPRRVSGLQGVEHITLAQQTSCVLTRDGAVSCWGSDMSGIFGPTVFVGSPTPLALEFWDADVLEIVGGKDHLCAILAGGRVECVGRNGRNQIGNMSVTFATEVPVPVTGLETGVASMCAGLYHSCALDTAGDMYCWGDNLNGQLGIGSSQETAPATKVPGLANISAIGCGDQHTCAFANGSELHCWGNNVSTQIALNQPRTIYDPVRITNAPTNIIALTAGDRHSCALSSDGVVHCWGDNEFAQLGVAQYGGAFYTPTPINVPK